VADAVRYVPLSAFIPASFLHPVLCDHWLRFAPRHGLAVSYSVYIPSRCPSGGVSKCKVNVYGILSAAVFSCTKRFVRAIISFFDRLSRMLLTWVLRAKSPFFPDMKKQPVQNA